jgi:hypothetical protein
MELAATAELLADAHTQDLVRRFLDKQR